MKNRQGRPTSPSKNHPLFLAREALGLTMRELASQLSLGKGGQNRIDQWEKGTLPKIVYANELARVLGFESGEKVIELCKQWREQHPDQVKLEVRKPTEGA